MLATGFIWTLATVGLAIWTPANLLDQFAGTSVITLDAFPTLPATNSLSGREVAHHLSPLVVVVHQAGRTGCLSDRGPIQACGAGTIVLATQEGCLLVTSRHVMEEFPGKSGLGKLVGVTLKNGQHANATVVGLHLALDLALLWISREKRPTEYVQPIRSFETIEVGEQVYVIGHPEGLTFSISDGLVAQTRGADLLQISAPISPGNSGGPVFDSRGRLIAVVQSTFDKKKNPNAENLNFAVRADDLRKAESWMLAKEGLIAINSIAAVVGNGHTYPEEDKKSD
jgi:S1-C subfamily serine protease